MESFEGKGGSGKSTVAYLLARSLAERGRRVLMVDADLNLAQAKKLGLPPSSQHSFGAGHLDRFSRWVRSGNPLVAAAESAGLVVPKMVPPGVGSRLVGFDDPYLASMMRRSESGIMLLDPGARGAADRGTHCWHYALGAIEQALIHFVERLGEHVIVDMTAGDDEATALHSVFDVRVVVVEPDRDSVAAAAQIIEQAASRGHRYVVVGNKIEEPGDVAYLRTSLQELTGRPNDDLAAALPKSPWVKAMSRGGLPPHRTLEEPTRRELLRLAAVIEGSGRDTRRRLRDVTSVYRSNVHAFHGGDERLLDVLKGSVDERVIDGAAAAGFIGELTDARCRELASTPSLVRPHDPRPVSRDSP